MNERQETLETVMSSPDWNRNIYSSDDNSYYAAPVFIADGRDREAPKKQAPSLSRSSTCRPTSALCLPHKKNKGKCRRCFERLSRLELCLFVLVLLLLLCLISLLFSWLFLLQGYRILYEGFPVYASKFENSSAGVDRTAKNHGGVVCTSKECVMMAGFLLENINEKVNPCEDFYEFACGNYGLNRNLPSNKPLRHTIADGTARLNKQLKAILQEPILESEPKWDKLAKGYYQKCLDEETLERNGMQAMKEIVNLVGGWPAIEGDSWMSWNHTWEEQLAYVMNRTGVNAVILEISVSHDPLNSTRSVIELDQPKWGIGSRWPYLMGVDDPTVKNYTSLMMQTAIALGADPKTAEKEMHEAMELELKLVNFSADDMLRRDPERGNNRFQMWQLKNTFKLINFDSYVRTVFHDLIDISPNHTVIIREIEYFTGIQHILSSTPTRVIANYISWRLVQGFSPFLPPTAREPFYQFKANQTGMFNSPPPDRWEDCVALSGIMMDMPVGKLFVEHHFEKERAMKKMIELTTYLKEEFIKQLTILDWMDDVTRRRAIQKANMIEYKSGFPAVIFNDTWMDYHWGMSIKPNEYLLQLTIRLKLVRLTEELLRLDDPLDKSMWYQTPAQVDAYYAPSSNEMIFPAGIMQFPFLTLGVPNYITYAMVGAVIGHEVSHAFDDQGGQYDESGNLFDWWDSDTAEKFAEKTRCFIRQYGSIKVPEANLNLNGHLSLGENIADNGGVKTAFNAYNAWRSNNTTPEHALPGFQNYTSEQMFFLAYANNWCSMVRPKHYIQLILTDPHAPSKYRAMIPLQNREEFATAFNCPRGSPMNPENKCQVW